MIRSLSARELATAEDFLIADQSRQRELRAARYGIVRVGNLEDQNWSDLLDTTALITIGEAVLDFTEEIGF